MFDLRYHVASLAAVFLALIIGIVVGVGISSGGFVSKSERSLLEERINELQKDLHAAQNEAKTLSQTQKAAQTFVKEAYPAVIAGRLTGKRIAVVFVGPVDTGLRDQVEHTLADGGAPSPARIKALKLPLDVPAIDRELAKRQQLAAYVGDA